MKKLLLLAVTLMAIGAVAQTIVKANQGAPGNQGPWPVVIVGGSSDGGSSIASTVNQGTGNDGGIYWNTREAWKLTLVPLASSITCAATATAAPVTPLASRTSLCMVNNSSVTIFIGGSGVTTAAGFPLLAGAAFCDNTIGAAYYCIVATSTADLRILEN